MRVQSEPHRSIDAAPGLTSRRRFLRTLVALAAAAAAPVVPRLAQAAALTGIPRGTRHPDPRRGIDASRVLTAAELTDAPHLVELFDAVREIPHIADGLRCYCGCAQIEGYRSLLTCYEDVGMARYCEICQGQARLAHGRWKEGQSLEQIRRATDARYGHGPVARAQPAPADAHCHD
jgi:hypothetical protein